MIYIIAAILIFGVLIAVHELGHFLAAKACGVRVNEFAIGMGPALLKKTKGDTQYSLRLLPIGGFCAMEGEEEDSSDPAALNNQGFWQKLLIFAAGALMNFLAGLIIILVLYAGVKAVNVPVIRGFAEGCPLESAAGLQEGDRILSIDGERIYTFSDVSLLLGRNKTGDFDLVIRRDGQKLRLENFHMERGEYLDQSGEKFTGFGLYFGAEELTFGGRLKYCWNQAVDFVRLVRLSLQMLITGEAGFSDMSGPVGIVSTITTVGEQSESAAAAAANIAYLAALIAVNLAVMNLLPLPALDGGKIFFLVVNALCMRIIRKQIPAKFENYVHLAGFILLMGLMLVITFQDVLKLFHRIPFASKGRRPFEANYAIYHTITGGQHHEQTDPCGRRGRGRRRAGQHPVHVQYPHPGRGAHRVPDPPSGAGRVPDHPGGRAGYGRRPGHRPHPPPHPHPPGGGYPL